MGEVHRRRRDVTLSPSARDAPGLATLVVGLLVLMAPLALQAFALLAAIGALAAWKFSGWLEHGFPEERDEDARRGR